MQNFVEHLLEQTIKCNNKPSAKMKMWKFSRYLSTMKNIVRFQFFLGVCKGGAGGKSMLLSTTSVGKKMLAPPAPVGERNLFIPFVTKNKHCLIEAQISENKALSALISELCEFL